MGEVEELLDGPNQSRSETFLFAVREETKPYGNSKKARIFPFEVTYEEIVKNPESYVDAVFSCLESEFLVMPKGAGFVEYPVFERGYEALKAATQGFSRVEPSNVFGRDFCKEPIFAGGIAIHAWL